MLPLKKTSYILLLRKRALSESVISSKIIWLGKLQPQGLLLLGPPIIVSRCLIIEKDLESSLTITSAEIPDSSSPRRKVGRPPNRSKPRIAAEVGEIDLDEEPLSAKEKGNQLPRQVLQKVVIPVNGRSSIASSLSSVRDQSSEYDTPGTSVAVTPAESLVKEDRSFKRPKRVISSIPSYQSEEPCKGKRKRLETDELIEADAQLARSLQEQEYGEDQGLTSRPRQTRAPDGLIVDSEDESLLSDLSGEHSLHPGDFPVIDMPSSREPKRRGHKALLSQAALAHVEGDRSQEESLDEEEISEAPMPSNKRVKTNHRTSLPSRAARDSAKQPSKDRTSRKILDSEDSELSDHSDDVSLFSSDTGSNAFEDSEDADEEADDVVGAASMPAVATNNPSSAPTAISATGRRGRRGATNSTRGRRSWQRRVGDRVSAEMLWGPCIGLRDILGYKRATKARESAS